MFEAIMLPILVKWALDTNPVQLILQLVFFVIALFIIYKPVLWFIELAAKKAMSPLIAHLEKIEQKFDDLTKEVKGTKEGLQNVQEVVTSGFKSGDERMTKIETRISELEESVGG